MTLPSGAGHSLVPLTRAQIPEILALNAKVRASLAPDEQMFLAEKDAQFFEDHFASGSGVIGIVEDGKLIAQSVIVNPTRAHPRKHLAELIIDAPPERMTVLQGVVVDPDHRGKGLMGEMIGAWMALAKEENRPHALTAVAPRNEASWRGFMKAGLHIHDTALSPYTNVEVYILHADVFAPDTAFNAKAGRERFLPVPALARQRRNFKSGYAITAVEGRRFTLSKNDCKL